MIRRYNLPLGYLPLFPGLDYLQKPLAKTAPEISVYPDAFMAENTGPNQNIL